MKAPFDTSILIVGAGPVGLALALELGLRDIPCLIVEKRDGVVHLPKMSIVSTRNMEFCRRWGISDTVRTSVWAKDRKLDFVYLESLLGRELARLPIPSYAEAARNTVTPEPATHCPQIFFDPILRKRVALQPTVSFAYNTTVESFIQDDEGVTATLLDEQGRRRDVRVPYLVGCDGATGLVRDALGIKLDGLGVVANSVNLYFRSPELINLHDKGWARVYRLVDEGGCWSELIPIDGKELWRLTMFQEPPQSPEAFLRRMFGADFPFEMINASDWERRDFVAETYRRDRVFIMGDAAHQCSPTGGLGMSTGVEEAVNLAWKLDAALKGWAGPRLLDSYTAERRPIAVRAVELSTRAFKAITQIPGWHGDGDGSVDRAALDDWKSNLNRYTMPDFWKMQYTYEGSPICVSDGTPADDPEPAAFLPTSRPGARAPHAWLADGRSVFDLFDEGFTLLSLGASPPSGEGLLAAAKSRGLPIKFCRVVEENVARVYVAPLVLVRPDGHVAWRGGAAPADPFAVIDHIRGA